MKIYVGKLYKIERLFIKILGAKLVNYHQLSSTLLTLI